MAPGFSSQTGPLPRRPWATGRLQHVDIHLESCQTARIDAFAETVRAAAPSALLLGGDTATGQSVTNALTMLEARVPCPIFFVLGNHDSYGGSIDAVRSVIASRTEGSPSLRWLPTAGVVSLSSDEGRPSAPDWAPFFACHATGAVLLETAAARPDVEILVLCGHTHGAGEYAPRPNVRVLTGGAEYGDPQLQGVLELP